MAPSLCSRPKSVVAAAVHAGTEWVVTQGFTAASSGALAVPVAGTLLRGISDAGLDVTVYGTGGNLTYAQMQQYAQFLPKDLFFNGAQGITVDPNAKGNLKRAQSNYFDALRKAGVKPDFGTQLAWDPAMIIVDAFRHVGPDATAEQIHQYIENLRGWTGIEGTYDFRNGDQRGIHDSAVALFR